jgi:hypothetical protein
MGLPGDHLTKLEQQELCPGNKQSNGKKPNQVTR